jgi:hypothetical protein
MTTENHIRQIPSDILIEIASYLSTVDLGALRRTCKHVEATLFNSFAAEFFIKKKFMISRESLQALIDISQHPQLSKHLGHVVIGLETYETGLPLVCFGGSEDRYRRYFHGRACQEALVETGEDLKMLAEAFGNLPNLYTVSLTDFNCSGHVRDGGDWHSYGSGTIFRETGIRLLRGFFFPGSNSVSHVFSTVIEAFSLAEASSPALKVIMKSFDQRLRDSAFLVPQSLKKPAPSVLSGLRVLFLCLNLTEVPTRLNPTSIDHNYDGEHPKYLLLRFLHHTINLVHLRLNFQTTVTRFVGPFLCAFGQRAKRPTLLVPDQSDPCRLAFLPNLRRLDLGSLTVSPDVLLTVVGACKPTLRELRLWKVILQAEDENHEDGEKANAWADFLGQLSGLDHLVLKHLRAFVGNQMQDVLFKNGKDGHMSESKEWLQHDMKLFPQNVLVDLVINREDFSSDDDSGQYPVPKSDRRVSLVLTFMQEILGTG